MKLNKADKCAIEAFRRTGDVLELYKPAEPERKRIAAVFKLLEDNWTTEAECLAWMLGELDEQHKAGGASPCVNGTR